MRRKGQEFDWWIKISTINYTHTYYFGDFKSYYEVKLFKRDFIQYLNQEKAKMINIQIELTDFKKSMNTTWKKDQRIRSFTIIKKESNKIISLIKLSRLIEITNSYSDIHSELL